MPRPRRRALIGALALVAIIGLGHGLAWRQATSALAVGVSDWVAQRRAERWTITHGPPTRGGWPFAARLTIDDVRLAAPARADEVGITYEASRIVLQLTPRQLDRLIILLEGPQRLGLGGTVVPFAADRLALSAPLAPDVLPPALDLAATRLEALLPDGPLLIHSARLALSPAPPTAAEATMAISLGVEAALLPPSRIATAFGREIDSLSTEALLVGPLRLSGPPIAAAAAWRDAGGTIDVPSLTLRWGPLTGDARLALTLDRALQPTGSGTLRLTGAQETLDALARAGIITGTVARTAQTVTALLARPPPEGGPPRVELPVALTNGTVSAARVPLLRVPPIDWPAPGTR